MTTTNRRLVRSGDQALASSACSRSSHASSRSGSNRSAKGVRTIARPSLMSNGSLNIVRNRAKALLAAGCESPTRLAARVTLRSCNNARKTGTRFRSIARRPLPIHPPAECHLYDLSTSDDQSKSDTISTYMTGVGQPEAMILLVSHHTTHCFPEVSIAMIRVTIEAFVS
ncbi:hypothetical protein [Sphingomonas sp. GC_Shp_2]|uniref:hypothetical protein n=1 Tax=Sphingomonas sp. GC_Shp_2 TaxID=2937384 RepID=UPI00226A1919|nr:hypothetical protein [Sphingomonas sp. GC_Shp_2]